MKHDLKGFDPAKVAAAETEMWRAYYEHKFAVLLWHLVSFLRTMFGFSYPVAIAAGFRAANAARLFRLQKGHETAEGLQKVRTQLECFYTLVGRHSEREFDHIRVAEAELHWWLVDRYPERYEMDREEALARHMATLFGMDHERLSVYAKHRAAAMVLQDAFEQGNVQAVDWKEIKVQLERSYSSLKDVLSRSVR